MGYVLALVIAQVFKYNVYVINCRFLSISPIWAEKG